MIKKKIEDSSLASHLEGLPEDGREVFLLANGQIRLTGLGGTTMVNQMRANFNLGVLETLVLGQAYIAGGLLASAVKGNDRIQLSVECGGPIGGIYIEAWACGGVRGYLKNVPIPIDKPLESSDLSLFYGPGFLSVTKILEGSKTPFTGQVMLKYGDLSKDLAQYYLESEQTPSLFSLGVRFDKQGLVKGAGGLFMQAMPGCSEETLQKLQDKSQTLPSLSLALSTGKSVKDYCIEQFSDFGVDYLGKSPVAFSCPCCRENFKTFLAGLPEDEKKAIIEQNIFPLELECFNCASVYSFSEEETKQILGVCK